MPNKLTEIPPDHFHSAAECHVVHDCGHERIVVPITFHVKKLTTNRDLLLCAGCNEAATVIIIELEQKVVDKHLPKLWAWCGKCDAS